MNGWQFLAACRGEDTADFFPPPHPETREDREARESRAKAICGVCPVRAECLDYALSVRESYGIWGGRSEAERRVLLRQRDRATEERRAG